MFSPGTPPKSLAASVPLATLAITSVAALMYLVSGWTPAEAVGRFGFIAMCLAAAPRFATREWVLACLAIGVSVGFLQQGDGSDNLLAALDLAVFFSTFIALLTLMQYVAERSDSVRRVGRFLITQPSGRRYYATAIGGHALAVFLNFGAISLMAPLIQKGAQDNDGRIDPALERRQLSALLRGFSWFVIWAPTSLAQAVMLTLFPGVDWPRLLALGLGTTIAMIVIGRALDRHEWRQTPLPIQPVSPPAPRHALSVLAVVCLSLIGWTFALGAAAGYTIAQALMFVAPAITLIWFVLQGRPHYNVKSVLCRAASFGNILFLAAPALLRTAVALGLSGYIGRAAALVLPTEEIALWLDLSRVSPWVFLASLPILITLGGQIALSPILLVVFFGELAHQLPDLPADPTLIVFSLSVGWALSMSASPNATATLLISAVCRIPPTTLTWRWNGRYALFCYATFLTILAFLV